MPSGRTDILRRAKKTDDAIGLSGRSFVRRPADGSCGNVVFCKQEERGSVFARLRRDKAYLYSLRLSRRNAMEPDEASAARREIGHEAPPPVVFYEMFVFKNCGEQSADILCKPDHRIHLCMLKRDSI